MHTAPTSSPNSRSARNVRRFILLTGYKRVRRCALLLELAGDPVIGNVQSVFERNRRLPIQHFAQTRVVAVAASDALRLSDVVALADLLARDLRHDVNQLIDRDHTILAEVDRLAMIAAHQAIDTFDTIVDVTVRA